MILLFICSPGVSKIVSEVDLTFPAMTTFTSEAQEPIWVVTSNQFVYFSNAFETGAMATGKSMDPGDPAGSQMRTRSLLPTPNILPL